jgi:hypothetical protein
MSKALAPTGHQWQGDQLIVAYANDVKICVDRVRPDPMGRLWAQVTAQVQDDVVNQARIDLLDQRQRIDFHAAAHARDGQVDWQALLVPVIALVQQGPELGHEGRDAGTSWARVKPAPTFLGAAEEEVVWVVPNLAAPGSITGVMAPRGLGKTHIAHALMVAVATGGSWCGVPISPGRVLLIDRDNSPREIRRRLRAWGGMQAQHLRILT